MSKNEPKENWLRDLGLLGLIVSDILVCTGLGVGIGYLAWHQLGLPWWVLLLTSMAGLALAFYRLYQYSKRDVK